ncbi:hypothetical protein HD554DRAFT_2177512 [Boletus coccyginus]|nr:hypothetical protein HD554DRAFT_2177512 [Boletus coccyginus]
MNVAGPSRASSSGRRAPRERVESTYEEDLLGLLAQLDVEEMDEIQGFFTQRWRGGEPLSDHDIAMNDLLQQARALAIFDQDRALAQRIAAGEDVGVEQRPPAVARQQNGNGNGHHQQAPRNDAAPSKTWGGWLSSIVDWAFGANASPESGPSPASTAVPRTPVAIQLGTTASSARIPYMAQRSALHVVTTTTLPALRICSSLRYETNLCSLLVAAGKTSP